jgi:glucokinase
MILGCDIGGTKTAVVTWTREKGIGQRREFPTNPRRGFQPVFDELCAVVESFRKDDTGAIRAISVSIGGPLDVLQGIIKSPPNLPGWDNIPLKTLLQNRFGLPVYIEHDGNAGALAEFHFGAGQGMRNLVFLTMGTGLGAGIILNGQLYRGTTDVAGELGHIRIAEEGPECYGKAGSLEGYCSGTGITRLSQMMFPGRWTDVPSLYASWKSGDSDAQQVFGRASRALGLGFAMIVDMLNPQLIILGGLGMRIHDALVEPALKTLAQEALPVAVAVCRVVPAALGESIGDLASVCAAIDRGKS